MLLYIPRYSPNVHGHGGERRTSQITEILAKNKLDLCTVADIYVQKQYLPLYPALYAYFVLRRYKSCIRFWSFRTVSNIGYRVLNLLNAFRIKDISCVIVEHINSDSLAVIIAAKMARIQLVLIPHNIESLVPGQKDPITKKDPPNGFNSEIDLLKLGDTVFTISKEEEWLLNLFGVNAIYFPYYPVSVVADELREIRNERKTSEMGSFLILGSAVNPPTREGMVTLLKTIESNEEDHFLIAGFGIKQLEEEFRHVKQFQFYCDATVAELQIIMKKCIAALIYTPYSTGALTRIAELLIAGIPVIGSRASLRNYHNFPGVYTTEINKLTEMLGRFRICNSVDFEINLDPAVFNNIVIEELKRKDNNSNS